MVETKNLKAFIFALLACLIWSSGFVIARGVHDLVQPVTLAFWRWMVALVVIIPIGYSSVRAEWPLIKAHWKYFLFMGVFGVGLFNTMVYTAAHYTSAHNIAIISSTAPIWTLLIAAIIGIEKLSRYNIGGAICAFSGVLIVISRGKLDKLFLQEWNYGGKILLASAFIWATYCVMLHYKPKGVSLKSFMTIIIAIGVICILPFYIWEVIEIAPTPFSLKAWAIYAYLGVASSIVAWLCWNHSTHILGTVKAGLVYYTIPVFSSIMAILILHEPVAIYHLVGFVMIFTGIIISNFKKISLEVEPLVN